MLCAHARVPLVRPLGHLFQLPVFCLAFVLWFSKLWSACRIIAHNGQTSAHRPLICFLVYFFLGPFFPLLPGILAHPRVHRPPKSREACKGHGASEWGVLGQRIPTPTPPSQAGWRMSYALDGTSGDGNPDWVGKTSSTLPWGGRRPVVCVCLCMRTVPHRTLPVQPDCIRSSLIPAPFF